MVRRCVVTDAFEFGPDFVDAGFVCDEGLYERTGGGAIGGVACAFHYREDADAAGDVAGGEPRLHQELVVRYIEDDAAIGESAHGFLCKGGIGVAGGRTEDCRALTDGGGEAIVVELGADLTSPDECEGRVVELCAGFVEERIPCFVRDFVFDAAPHALVDRTEGFVDVIANDEGVQYHVPEPRLGWDSRFLMIAHLLNIIQSFF